MFYGIRYVRIRYLLVITVLLFASEIAYWRYATKVSPLLEALKDFTSIANDVKVPVFVIDEKLLRLIIDSGHHRNLENIIENCDIKFVSIGTTTAFLNSENYNAFRALFDVSIIPSMTNNLPDGSFLPKSSHYLLFHRKFKVSFHCVIFYLFKEHFFYYSQIDYDSADAVVLVNASYGLKHPGIYHRSSLRTKLFVSESIILNIPSDISRFLKAKNESFFLSCNITRANEFKRFALEYNEEKEFTIFKRKSLKLLAFLSDALYSIGISFWISSGTCLGWFRQCDLIPYTKDIDIGIWAADHSLDIIETLESHDFRLIQRFGKVNDSYELSFLFEDLKLDIFFFYDTPAYAWNGGTQSKTGKKFKYIFKRFTLCWTLFLEIVVKIPCNTEQYVVDNYGDGWFQPVKEWDWKKSPSNVHENGQWLKDEWDEVIQLF